MDKKDEKNNYENKIDYKLRQDIFLSSLPVEVVNKWNETGLHILYENEISMNDKLQKNTLMGFSFDLIEYYKYQPVNVNHFQEDKDSKLNFIKILYNENEPSKKSKDDLFEYVYNLINKNISNDKSVIFIINENNEYDHLDVMKEILKKKSLSQTRIDAKTNHVIIDKYLDIYPISIDLKDDNKKEALKEYIKNDIISFSTILLQKICNYNENIVLSSIFTDFICHNVNDIENQDTYLDKNEWFKNNDNNSISLDQRTIEEIPGINNHIKSKISKIIKLNTIKKSSDGIILYGPPGTGKTMLATVIANSCNRKIYYSSYADWQSKDSGSLGTTLNAMKKSFKEASDNAPSVLFIDEIDSIGKRVPSSDDHNSSYMKAVINALLEEIQGSKNKGDVLIIGATNNINDIDDAIKRRGRLGEHIEISYPTLEGRKEILQYYLKIDDNTANKLAHRVGKCSPADMENFANKVDYEISEGITLENAVNLTIDEMLKTKYPNIDYKNLKPQIALGLVGSAFVYSLLYPHQKITNISLEPGLESFAYMENDTIPYNTIEDKFHYLMYILSPYTTRKIYQNKKIKIFNYKNIIIPFLNNDNKIFEYISKDIEETGFQKNNILNKKTLKKGLTITKNILDMKTIKIFKNIPGHVGSILSLLDNIIDSPTNKNQTLNSAEKELEKMISPYILVISDIAKILLHEKEITGDYFLELFSIYNKKHHGDIKGKLKKQFLKYL